MTTAVGKSAPRRQGAVSACTSGSDVNPVLVGGYYESTPTAVNAKDVVWAKTDGYGRLLTVRVPYDNDWSGTLLASAARTATCSSTDQTNYGARGVTVWLGVTVVSGSETLTLRIQAKDPVSASYRNMLVGASITAVEDYVYMVYPGVAAGAEQVTETIGYPLPRDWRVHVTHDSGSPFTYSLGYCYNL